MKALQTLFTFVIFGLCSAPHAAVNEYFNTIKSDPNALYVFLKDMPKGGELHYHFSGGFYAESFLNALNVPGYCLDAMTSTLTSTPCVKNSASSPFLESTIYNQTIRAWSMKDFIAVDESNHDHFFATFFKFSALVHPFEPQLLADIMIRAARQHELYMELIMFNAFDLIPLSNNIKNAANYTEKKHILLSNPVFQQRVKQTERESRELLKQTHKLLHCDTNPQQGVCNLTIKFQTFVLREQPLDAVFVQALYAFAVASQSDDIVGVNLVQAEDGIISLRDYHKHMEIFKFLHSVYPQVHIALHAGEIAFGDVTDKDLSFHINDAINVGNAQRIGHGVDIAYEDGASNIVKKMASLHIPVEINLISNQEILHIKGAQHPLNYYLSNKVPVVLSTDDEGILRTDLTTQYVTAVMQQGLDYNMLKYINRNALTYAFLPGKSIWLDAEMASVVPECKNLYGNSCLSFIKNNAKATIQWQLEKQLAEFENKF